MSNYFEILFISSNSNTIINSNLWQIVTKDDNNFVQLFYQKVMCSSLALQNVHEYLKLHQINTSIKKLT